METVLTDEEVGVMVVVVDVKVSAMEWWKMK